MLSSRRALNITAKNSRPAGEELGFERRGFQGPDALQAGDSDTRGPAHRHAQPNIALAAAAPEPAKDREVQRRKTPGGER